MPWSKPNSITPATKIKDTDDLLEANMTNLQAYVNGDSPYSPTTGLTANMVDKTSVQTISGSKTFSTAIQATGGLVGVVTGSLIGNVTGTADNALAIGGEVVTDSVISTSTTIPAALNSVKTAKDAADAAQATADSKVAPTDYATETTGGTIKMKIVGSDLYITNNGVNP